MDSYFDLGSHHRPISTTSPAAQIWFDRGLNWTYGFHHDEAVDCFKKVIEHDPDCAMGYWGLAYALGPYYNMPWNHMGKKQLKWVLKRTYKYSREAQQRIKGATSAEKAIINALATRFQGTDIVEDDVFAQWDTDYANAMRDVYAQFPRDYDICALTAEALMCRTPWMLWDLVNRVPAEGSDTAEAIHIIESTFQHIGTVGARPHPGLLHFYIHIMEMGPEPEKALPASDTLWKLLPDAGHLVHMPSHIYILCGEYEKALQCNRDAVIADHKYLEYNPIINKYLIYYLHNVHFQIYAASLLGQYGSAMQAAEEIIATIPPEALYHKQQYIVNYVEAYTSMKAHVLVRFGKWEAIKAEPLPEDQELYCVTTAMWHYAKGLAYAATGDITNAALQQQLLAEAHERVPEERLIYNNMAREILQVGIAMLEGELSYRRGNYDVAFEQLRHTVHLYDTLNYTEPWAWMQPPRHALGALLLEQGHIEEATAVYRADLGLDDSLVRPSQHLNNIWSLQGYTECLEQAGDTEQAAIFREKLAAAQAKADIPVNVSCFCRQEQHCCG